MMTIAEYAASRGVTPGAVSKRIKNSDGFIKVEKKGNKVIISEEGVAVLDEIYAGNFERNERVLKVMIVKQSPKRSEGSVNYRIGIPAEWAKKMGITKEEPQVKVSFNDNKIIIEKE